MVSGFGGIALVAKNSCVSVAFFSAPGASSRCLFTVLLFLFGVASDLSVKLAALSSVVNWSVLISSRPRFLGIGVELIVVVLMTFDFFSSFKDIVSANFF